MCEDDAGFERPIYTRNDRFSRQHHESGYVAGIVLDSVRQDLEAVKLCRSGACDCGGVAKVVDGDELGGAGCIIDGLACDVEAEFSESVFALR